MHIKLFVCLPYPALKRVFRRGQQMISKLLDAMLTSSFLVAEQMASKTVGHIVCKQH